MASGIASGLRCQAFNLAMSPLLICAELWRRSAIKSAAEFDGVTIKILESERSLKTCKMVSTTVTVLPVPGGP